MKKGTKLIITVLSIFTFFFVSNKVNALSYDDVKEYVVTNKTSAIAYIDDDDLLIKRSWYAFVYDDTTNSVQAGVYLIQDNGLYDLYKVPLTRSEAANIDNLKWFNQVNGKDLWHNHYVPLTATANLYQADKNVIITENKYSAYTTNYSTTDSNMNNKSTHSADDVGAVATIENISLEEAKAKWSYQTDVYVCDKTSCDVNGDGAPDDVEYTNYYYKFLDGDNKIHLVDTGNKIGTSVANGGELVRKNKEKIINIENIGKDTGNEDPCNYLFGSTDDPNSAAYLMQSIFNYMKFIGIVLAVIMTIVDLTKAVAGGNMEDELKKIGPKSIKRIAYAVLIFLLPTLINVFFKIFGLWGTCNIS